MMLLNSLTAPKYKKKSQTEIVGVEIGNSTVSSDTIVTATESEEMIPEKSKNFVPADNNNLLEATNIPCTKNFAHLEQQLFNNKMVGSSSEQHKQQQQQQQQQQQNNDEANIKFAKDIDDLAKIYHQDNDELMRATGNTNNRVIITLNDHNFNDAGMEADDEDEFERVFEDSMQDLEKSRDNFEASSSDESDDFDYYDNNTKTIIDTIDGQEQKMMTNDETRKIHNRIYGLPCINQSGELCIETPAIKIGNNSNKKEFPLAKHDEDDDDNVDDDVVFDINKNKNKNKKQDMDESDSDEDSADKIMNEIAKSPKLLPNEMLNNHKLFLFRPFSLPFQERRRLSQCKEEDEYEENDTKFQFGTKSDSTGNTDSPKNQRNSLPIQVRSPPVPESQLMSDKFKELERLRDQFRRKLEEIHPTTITTSVSDNTTVNTQSPISTNIPQSKVYKGKFVVTRAEENSLHSSPGAVSCSGVEPQKEIPKLRKEAANLRNLRPQMNSFTIHFPNSKGISGHTRMQNVFPPFNRGIDTTTGGINKDCSSDNDTVNSSTDELQRHSISFQPHLDKQFFDTSLVEIRPISESTKSLDNCDNIINKTNDDISIWVPRSSNKVTPASSKNSVDDQDGFRSGCPSRPSSAPAEPNAKAARKASKRMEKEARRQEKELRNKEKEARKFERETARRLEREQAKLEKLNRNSEKIARSTERLAPRSGSLERRRSGEVSPVLNQSTVHGIASPNKRPTLFDVFRPRTKSDAKRKEKDASLHSGSEKDNSSTSSNHSASGGVSGSGIMKAMKNVVQNTVGHHRHHQNSNSHQPSTEKPSVKYKDGSAHPHAGSDQQYYHTVTAVRRVDGARSPMTKVMDLFRYRSNSAVNEADKRKARVAAHQQLLAVQKSKLTKLYDDIQ